MALPGADNLCIQLVQGPGEICVVLPGGFALCVQGDVEWDDVGALAKNLLGQINTALTPLAPFFTVFDVLIALFECIKAVKEAFGPAPNPAKLIECLKNLQEAIDKLLALHPAISIPKTIKSILNVVILFLRGIRTELVQLLNFATEIATALTRATTLGNFELQIAGECASDQFDVELANLNQSVAPLSRLIGVINLLFEIAGLPCMQIPLGPIKTLSQATLDVVDAAIAFVELIRDAIPSLDLVLGTIPAPEDPC